MKIISFKDKFHTLDKEKQIESLMEQNSIHEEIDSLDKLDEILKSSNEKIVILREKSDYIEFDNILKQEYPQFYENIEVIPELYYSVKLTEADINNPAVDVQENNFFLSVKDASNPTKEHQFINRYVIPLVPSLNKEYFSELARLITDSKGSAGVLLIHDKNNGYWVGDPKSIVESYGDTVQEFFKALGERDYPRADIAGFDNNYGPNGPAGADINYAEIRKRLGKNADSYKNTLNTAQDILKKVKSKQIKLNQEKVDQMVKENPKIVAVVRGIIANLQLDPLPAGSYIQKSSDYLSGQSAFSKVLQATGADKDIGTAAANMRKAGLGLVVDIGEKIIQDAKEKSNTMEKDRSTGSEETAFLSDDRAEEFLGTLFSDFKQGVFK
jgi:hypothetical protein